MLALPTRVVTDAARRFSGSTGILRPVTAPSLGADLRADSTGSPALGYLWLLGFRV